MCGQFTLSKTAEELAKTFYVQRFREIDTQYIALTQMLIAVLHNTGGLTPLPN